MENKDNNRETLNVLRRAAQRQAAWAGFMESMGHEVKTTFYGDLTIAEAYGPDAVRETYARVCKEWRANVEYYTEFVLALNHKIWEHYETNEALARVYDELWREADACAADNLTGGDLQYYLNKTD